MHISQTQNFLRNEGKAKHKSNINKPNRELVTSIRPQASSTNQATGDRQRSIGDISDDDTRP
jgi:hypothetical protein